MPTSRRSDNEVLIADAYGWLKPAPRTGEKYLEIRISRKLLLALTASLLLHALLLYLFIRQHLELDMRPVSQNNNTLSVQINPLVPLITPPARVKPPPATPPRAKKPKVRIHHAQPPVLTRATPAKTQATPPINVPKPVPKPAPVPSAATDVPTDMSSYINAVRARRNAADSSAATENVAPQPSADEIRMAKIQRNLQPQGGGGIFEIKRVGTRSGTFLFRGWGNTYTSPLQETITVETDGNTDIEHAMIRKMISIIRKRHNGDFSWESQRLNRVITLSARLQDNAGLEDFLMTEFFGPTRKPSEQ